MATDGKKFPINKSSDKWEYSQEKEAEQIERDQSNKPGINQKRK